MFTRSLKGGRRTFSYRAWGRPLLLQRRAGWRAAHTLHTEWQLWRLGGAVCRSEQLMLERATSRRKVIIGGRHVPAVL